MFFFFFLILRIRFLKISLLNCEQNEKKNHFKKKEHNKEFTIQNVVITFILFKCPRSNGNSIDFHLYILL